jgi:uncharacterized protein YecE (DUF72 family)
MQLLAGTSGYAYAEWKGSFYPEALPAREMLAFYADSLPAVEINNTFYRLPKKSVLAGWAVQVPDDFRFAIKASRRITHFKRLVDTESETGFLLESCAALGAKLGALLFQLPPDLPLDLGRLERFLALLPAGTPAAFELRHPSWQIAAVDQLLAARGCTRVTSDSEEDDGSAALACGMGWGYLRLRRSSYDRAALAGWTQRISAQGWERALVFFKHEDAGAGPALAAQFLELSGRARDRRPAAARTPARDRAHARKRG